MHSVYMLQWLLGRPIVHVGALQCVEITAGCLRMYLPPVQTLVSKHNVAIYFPPASYICHSDEYIQQFQLLGFCIHGYSLYHISIINIILSAPCATAH